MINIHSKLIREELAKMGVDAFAVLICITSHTNKQKTAWPGIERLRKMTGLSKERTYKAIAKLIELNHIQRKQVNQKGNFGHTVYRLTIKYLSIFMGVSDCEMYYENIEPLAAFPEHGNTEHANTEHGNTEHAKPEHGNTEHLSIEQPLSIEQLEVLEKGKSAPAEFLVTTIALETIPNVEGDVPRPTARPTSKISELQKNINAHSEAAEHFLRLLQAKGHSLNGAEKYAAAYFLNEQRKTRWVSLLIPTDAGAEHRWLGEHGPGIIQWAQRQPQFERNNGIQPTAPAAPVQIRREI